MQDPAPPIGAPPPLTWTDAGAPRSAVFGDIYFQPGEGLAETRAVFLEGCGLPGAWRGRRRFVVGELGFGAGLNILALLEMWRRTRAPEQRLHVFTVEAYPLAAEDARRALSAFPDLEDLARPLLARWPRRARGWHRLTLDDLNFSLDLAVADAVDALEAWTGRADAWFLDGFAPSANPAMWSDEVLGLVAARSSPGARAATFTVAGSVRRALAAHGFEVERRPGYGRKRQRLEARLPGLGADPDPPGRIAVVGGGIAGASLIRAFRSLGVEPVQVAPSDEPGASGNPAALVTPALDAGEGVGGRLYAHALARAVDLYAETPGAVIARGVLQLEREPRDGPRFDRIAQSGLFSPGSLIRIDPALAAALLEETVAPGGLRLEEGVVVRPDVVVRTWAEPPLIRGTVARLERHADGWRLLDADGRTLHEADIVCLATGSSLRRMLGDVFQVVRGQATWTSAVQADVGAAWGGYAIPLHGGGVLFGATHDRDDEDLEPRVADDERNRALLARGRPRLAARLERAPLSSRVGLRLTTPDRLPMAGMLDDGLFVLGGLGSRGFCSAPLLAEHVAALAVGAASPMPGDVAQATRPQRFAIHSQFLIASSQACK